MSMLKYFYADILELASVPNFTMFDLVNPSPFFAYAI